MPARARLLALPWAGEGGAIYVNALSSSLLRSSCAAALTKPDHIGSKYGEATSRSRSSRYFGHRSEIGGKEDIPFLMGGRGQALRRKECLVAG